MAAPRNSKCCKTRLDPSSCCKRAPGKQELKAEGATGPSTTNSHLARLRLKATAARSPAMIPSSRKCRAMSKEPLRRSAVRGCSAAANSKGPSGSPCWTPERL